MSIGNTNGVRSKVDLTYNLESLASNKTPLKVAVPTSPPIDATLSISHEAKALLEKEKEQYIGLNNYSPEELERMFEQLKGSTDESNNPLKIKLQCLKIAMRIISGDTVPSKDKAFLAEHEPQMLSNALLLRRQKDKPKNHKSLLDDDKGNEPTDLSAPVSFEKSEGALEESVSADEIALSIDLEA